MTNLDDIVDIFEMLGDWDQRYQYLVELGDTIGVMPDAEKISDNQVKGCMSTVYVCPHCDATNPGKIYFTGFCDTAIIRGVLAILLMICSGRTIEEIQALDIDEIFERLHLADHLSPNRHVGIYAIVVLMKALAAQLAQHSKSAVQVG